MKRTFFFILALLVSCSVYEDLLNSKKELELEDRAFSGKGFLFKNELHDGLSVERAWGFFYQENEKLELAQLLPKKKEAAFYHYPKGDRVRSLSSRKQPLLLSILYKNRSPRYLQVQFVKQPSRKLQEAKERGRLLSQEELKEVQQGQSTKNTEMSKAGDKKGGISKGSPRQEQERQRTQEERRRQQEQERQRAEQQRQEEREREAQQRRDEEWQRLEEERRRQQEQAEQQRQEEQRHQQEQERQQAEQQRQQEEEQRQKLTKNKGLLYINSYEKFAHLYPRNSDFVEQTFATEFYGTFLNYSMGNSRALDELILSLGVSVPVEKAWDYYPAKNRQLSLTEMHKMWSRGIRNQLFFFPNAHNNGFVMQVSSHLKGRDLLFKIPAHKVFYGTYGLAEEKRLEISTHPAKGIVYWENAISKLRTPKIVKLSSELKDLSVLDGKQFYLIFYTVNQGIARVHITLKIKD